MLKNLSNLGTTLNRVEQQSINGGGGICYEFPPYYGYVNPPHCNQNHNNTYN